MDTYKNLDHIKGEIDRHVTQSYVKAGNEKAFHAIQANKTPGYPKSPDEHVIMVADGWLTHYNNYQETLGDEGKPIEPLYTKEVER